jgi:hypothetical protein
MLANVKYVHLLITFSMAFVTIGKIKVQDFLKNKKWQLERFGCFLQASCPSVLYFQLVHIY